MELKGILKDLKTTSYSDDATNELTSKLLNINLDSSYYLLLLVGPYQKEKRKYLARLSEEFKQKITHIDLKEIITNDELETANKTDSLFDNLPNESKILFFSNADYLCGAYTGYTYSSQRYATPQERYLLQKLDKIEKIVIFDIQDPYNIDATMRRFAHHAILFDKPKNFLSKLTWKLGSITFHGHQFETQRPA
ncbi:MAG: hypothetical protein ACFCU6_15545 [Balneolaceae bacterium]